MNARDDMLYTIDSILGPSRADREAELRDIFPGQSEASISDTINLFLERLHENGCEAIRVSDYAAGAAWTARYLDRHGYRSVMLAGDESLAQSDFETCLVSAFPRMRVERMPTVLPDEEARLAHRAASLECDVSITSAIAGFAADGAVAIASSKIESRSVSLLVLAHIAIVQASDVTEDLAAWSSELAERLRARESSAITIVAGPSKTADIEKVLVTGVHGPERFAVIVIDETLTPGHTISPEKGQPV